MKLKTDDLTILCQCAISAAYLAGHQISNAVRSQIKIKNKADQFTGIDLQTKVGETIASKVVTEVDLLCQSIILEALTPTLNRFDLGLLSEESIDDSSRFGKDFFWCIDPLDGTLAFIEDCPGYAVSIALISKNGDPTIGVIYDPVNNNLYSAIKGMGVKKNGISWQPKTINTNEPMRLITDRTFINKPNIATIILGLKEIAGKLNHTDITIQAIGGAAMNAMWILEKGSACYFKFPKNRAGGGSLWDYAATAAIYSECGAHVSNINGDRLDLNRKDSTFMNHEGILYASNDKIARMIIENHTNWINS